MLFNKNIEKHPFYAQLQLAKPTVKSKKYKGVYKVHIINHPDLRLKKTKNQNQQQTTSKNKKIIKNE
eukprot:UN27514